MIVDVRVVHARPALPLAPLVLGDVVPNQGKRRSVNVFTPSMRPAKSFSMYWLIPSTIETTAMRNITPIITPSSVKKLLASARGSAQREPNGLEEGHGVEAVVRAELRVTHDGVRTLDVVRRYSYRSASTGSSSRRAGGGKHAEQHARDALAPSAATIASGGIAAGIGVNSLDRERDAGRRRAGRSPRRCR